MALITCHDCGHQVSDKAVACPSCGCPVSIRKARKRYRKLPNGFGSIKHLSGSRRKPYAAYPPVKEFRLNGTPELAKAIGYYETWHEAYSALSEYNKDPYDTNTAGITFSEVYGQWFKAKYEDNKKKPLSAASRKSTMAGYKNISALHNMPIASIKTDDMQKVMDSCKLKHSSLELMLTTLKQVMTYALQRDYIAKDYSQFVKINIADDDERGEAFTQKELDVLWANCDMPAVKIILMLIYSGFRISAFGTLDINLDERYFKGGVKTKAGKGRIVPIHKSIYDFAAAFAPSDFSANKFRSNEFYPTLEELGILYTENRKKHTPHDCRHTFSWLCDKYKVDDVTKHMLMGHSLGNDVEKTVYAHRTLDELRSAIDKIKV